MIRDRLLGAWALVGVVVGTGSALGLTHFLGSFLFGVKPLDLVSFRQARRRG